MAFTRDWDETFPPDTQAANLLGQDIRDFKTDIRERVAALSGTIANRPAVGDMITGWGAYGGNGMLYFSTDEGKVYQWSGAAWVDVTTSIGSSRIPTVGGAFVNPTAIATLVWRAPYACTATFIHGYVPSGQVTINAQKNLTNDLHSTDIAITGASIVTTAVNQNSAFAVGDSLSLEIVSVDSGSPTYAFVQVDFTRP